MWFNAFVFIDVCWVYVTLVLIPFAKEEKIQFAVEALRRASAKFAGRQKVHVSNKFGFTKYAKKEYHDHKASGRLVPDGTNVRWLSSRGPLWRLIGRENAWGMTHATVLHSAVWVRKSAMHVLNCLDALGNEFEDRAYQCY